MKYYVREKYVLNQNLKEKHIKKYQHNMNIISFLKSNYKYKRRCTVLAWYQRLLHIQYVWRQQQTHQLSAVDASMSDHRNVKRIFQCKTTKISKFPRIFIAITQPRADASATVVSGMWRFKGTTLSNRTYAVNHQIYIAYADANEDTTDIDSYSSSYRSGGGVHIRYQHSNYDKVSTITSTPSLRCQRQNRHNQMKSLAATAFLSTPPTLLSSLPLVYAKRRTVRCLAKLRHQINVDDMDDNSSHSIHRKMARMPPEYTIWNTRKCGINDTDTNNKTLKSHINSTFCQSVDQLVNVVAFHRSYTLSLLFTLLIAFSFGVRNTAAGACWQTVLGSGKCNDIFSFNMSKTECCGANQEFAYTDREPTSVEYFFATAIGGGMECTPCLESCRNVRCGPNKKCVKRKGRPKCVCAPECGAARRRRLEREQHLINQHHSAFMPERDDASEGDRRDSYDLNSKRERSRQSRDTHSLSSEITTKQVNIGPEKQNQNQRKYIHIHMQEDYAHQQEAPPPKRKNQQPKGNRRLLLTTNVEHTEKPTTRRIQLFSNVRTTFARRHFGKNNNNKHNARHQDTDLSHDYEEEEEHDDEPPEASAGVVGKINDSNRNDDATRFPNQSLSRHKPETNKNHHKHDLQTTKTQQREQYSANSNKSNSRQTQQHGRHAENTSNLHRHRHRHRHHEQEQHHHHQHHRHSDLHQQQHNNRQPSIQNQNPNENHGERQNNKQQHKDQRWVQKHPKNHKDHNSSTSITTISIASSASGSNNAYFSTLNTTPLSTTSQPVATPVNFKLNSGGEAFDQSRYTNHGSKIVSSSSSLLPLSISYLPSSASSSLPPVMPAASTHSYMQSPSSVTMYAAATTTSSSSSSLFVNANGVGVSPQPHYRDHNGRPTAVETVTTDSYNDNDNTISSLHLSGTYHQERQQNGGVILDSFFDQFDDGHGYASNQNGVTITDSIRPSNPVCGTDGRTYNTECQLRKRACRTDNPNLQVAYRGHCKTTCNSVQCMNGLTCVEDQYTMPHCIACKIDCPIDGYGNDNDFFDANRAVCGADGKTYKSMCDINRITCQIGRSIGIAYPGPCRGNQITCDDINCGSKQTCLIDLQTHQPRCTPCRYKCSRKRRPTMFHFEEDKVCGVNNRTYNSWCEMRKDSCLTGFYIEVKYPGHCH